MKKDEKNNSSLDAEQHLNDIDAIIRAKRSNKSLDEQVIDKIVEYVEESMYPFTLNATGIKNIGKLCRKFEVQNIIEAVDISAERYLKYDEDDEIERDSVEMFIKKIGGILNLQNRPPVDQKVAYVKGICRNRFDYWNEYGGTETLKDYVDALKAYGYSQQDMIRDFDEAVIPETKNCANWTQWRNLIQGWTADLNKRSHEPEFDVDALYKETNHYIDEKRKGGENSYQAYKPLRDKVEDLCFSEMASRPYSSASKLCEEVAYIIESQHPDLLTAFQPYKNYERDGVDWKIPTFYGWCNTHYKNFNENL
jgi:hypothetical protein